MIWNGKERRRFPRKEELIGVSIVEVNNKRLPYKFDQEIGKNISLGGMCIELTKELPVSALVWIELMINKELPFIRAKGKVIWIKSYRRPPSIIEGVKVRERNNFIMGMEFLEITQQDKEKIRKFVEAG